MNNNNELSREELYNKLMQKEVERLMEENEKIRLSRLENKTHTLKEFKISLDSNAMWTTISGLVIAAVVSVIKSKYTTDFHGLNSDPTTSSKETRIGYGSFSYETKDTSTKGSANDHNI